MGFSMHGSIGGSGEQPSAAGFSSQGSTGSAIKPGSGPADVDTKLSYVSGFEVCRKLKESKSVLFSTRVIGGCCKETVSRTRSKQLYPNTYSK